MVELVRALAWPVAVLIIVFVLRPELLRLVGNLSRRVETATSLIIRPGGIEIKGPAPPSVQQRKRQFTVIVRGLTDKPALDALADALNVAKTPDIRAQQAAIIAEMNGRVATARDMDELTAQVRGILPEEFER